MSQRQAWLDFLAVPISGDARSLALRLALDPFTADVEVVNPRVFAESLRLSTAEYERAWSELRDPRVGWIHSHHFDRPMLKPDALPRRLMAPNLDAIVKATEQIVAPLLEKKGFRK